MEETAAWSATHRLEYKIWLMLLCCMYLHNNVFCISCHNQRLCMYTCCLTNDTVGYAYDVVNLNIISPRLSLILSLRYSQRFIRLSRTMTVCWIVCHMRHHEMRDTAFALPWSIYILATLRATVHLKGRLPFSLALCSRCYTVLITNYWMKSIRSIAN